jgi:DNA primase
MTLLDLLEQDGIRLKRVAGTHGGEYAGACPSCGGRDRFRVWPEEDGGRFWCRGCGKSGDAIQWVRDFRGLSFQEACAELGREPMTKHSQKMSPMGVKTSAMAHKVKPLPSLKWQERAGAFLNVSPTGEKEALSFLRGRGLRDDTIRAAGLGRNPVDCYEDREAWGLEPLKDDKGNVKKLWLPAGLVIPLWVAGAVHRLRIRRTAGDPRYVIVSGSDMRPMIFHPERKSLVIVESELDGLLVDQEVVDSVGTVALGTAQAKPDAETERLLRGADILLIALDFDEAGARASWKYWLETYPNARRWPTPTGKDPSDYFQQGGNVRGWIEAGLSSEKPSKGKETDQAVKPFPREWLERFGETELERLAIATVCGRLSDSEAVRLLN